MILDRFEFKVRAALKVGFPATGKSGGRLSVTAEHLSIYASSIMSNLDRYRLDVGRAECERVFFERNTLRSPFGRDLGWRDMRVAATGGGFCAQFVILSPQQAQHIMLALMYLGWETDEER